MLAVGKWAVWTRAGSEKHASNKENQTNRDERKIFIFQSTCKAFSLIKQLNENFKIKLIV